MRYLTFALVLAAVVGMSSCKCRKGETPVVPEPVPQATTPLSYMPKATAFTMSGDYADHVAVTLGADGELVYFPAPTDITDNSRPVRIGDGWWLNRQGLGPNSVFTKYTFDEYRAFKEVPTPEQIKAAIIPGARVTDFMKLPVTISEANRVPATSLLQYLK